MKEKVLTPEQFLNEHFPRTLEITEQDIELIHGKKFMSEGYNMLVYRIVGGYRHVGEVLKVAHPSTMKKPNKQKALLQNITALNLLKYTQGVPILLDQGVFVKESSTYTPRRAAIVESCVPGILNISEFESFFKRLSPKQRIAYYHSLSYFLLRLSQKGVLQLDFDEDSIAVNSTTSEFKDFGLVKVTGIVDYGRTWVKGSEYNQEDYWEARQSSVMNCIDYMKYVEGKYGRKGAVSGFSSLKRQAREQKPNFSDLSAMVDKTLRIESN